jgi:hypothetical protein
MPRPNSPSRTVMAARDHLEAHLGQSLSSYRLPRFANSETDIELHAFPNQPGKGNLSVCSLGLSGLRVAHGKPDLLHQEVVFSLIEDQLSERVLEDCATVLASIAQSEHLQPMHQGEVHRLVRPFGGDGGPSHLMVDVPQYFPREFWSTVSASDRSTSFVWLIPLYASEAAYAQDRGYEAIADVFEKADPDLLDLGRASCVPVD